MKRKLLFALIALLAAITSAQAAGTLIDGLYYYLFATDQTAEVTYYSSLTSSNSSYVSGELTIPETVIYNDITYSVTSIGEYAFRSCSSLTSVTISNSVTSIGVGAFASCSSLTSITIPNSVTSIGGSAFEYCSSLPVIDNLRYADTFLVEAVDKTLSTYNIKEGTKWIGSQAFEGCGSLTNITIPESVTSIGKEAFSNCDRLPVIDNLRYADTYLVEATDKKTLSTYNIKEGTKWIGYWAFGNCSSLTNITIPNSVTSIGSSAFLGCSSLTSITIPNSVARIGDYAFLDCNSLTSVTIPNSVTSIGEGAFARCSSLTAVHISDIASWCTIKFGHYDANPLNNGANLYLNGELVTDLIIPESVETIKNYAFYNCKSLTSITIPNSVTSIGGWAFYSCSSLSSIYNYAKAPQSIGSSSFNNVNTNTCVLYVPKESVEVYKNAPVWQDFYQIIGVDVPEDKDTAVGDVFDQNNLSATKKVIENGHIYLLTPDGRKLNLQGAEVR